MLDYLDDFIHNPFIGTDEDNVILGSAYCNLVTTSNRKFGNIGDYMMYMKLNQPIPLTGYGFKYKFVGFDPFHILFNEEIIIPKRDKIHFMDIDRFMQGDLLVDEGGTLTGNIETLIKNQTKKKITNHTRANASHILSHNNLHKGWIIEIFSKL